MSEMFPAFSTCPGNFSESEKFSASAGVIWTSRNFRDDWLQSSRSDNVLFRMQDFWLLKGKRLPLSFCVCIGNFVVLFHIVFYTCKAFWSQIVAGWISRMNSNQSQTEFRIRESCDFVIRHRNSRRQMNKWNRFPLPLFVCLLSFYCFANLLQYHKLMCNFRGYLPGLWHPDHLQYMNI